MNVGGAAGTGGTPGGQGSLFGGNMVPSGIGATAAAVIANGGGTAGNGIGGDLDLLAGSTQVSGGTGGNVLLGGRVRLNRARWGDRHHLSFLLCGSLPHVLGRRHLCPPQRGAGSRTRGTGEGTNGAMALCLDCMGPADGAAQGSIIAGGGAGANVSYDGTKWRVANGLGGSGVTINSTNGLIPVRSNSTTFIDSPLSVSGGAVTISGTITSGPILS